MATMKELAEAFTERAITARLAMDKAQDPILKARQDGECAAYQYAALATGAISATELGQRLDDALYT